MRGENSAVLCLETNRDAGRLSSFVRISVCADLANPQPMGKRNFSSVKQLLPALNRWNV